MKSKGGTSSIKLSQKGSTVIKMISPSGGPSGAASSDNTSAVPLTTADVVTPSNKETNNSIPASAVKGIHLYADDTVASFFRYCVL